MDQHFREDSMLGLACRPDIPYQTVSFPQPTEIHVQGATPSHSPVPLRAQSALPLHADGLWSTLLLLMR